jgi:glyoxylase-like metal-dependent hydrolase (beta-lactamase superfamily II)
MTFNTTRSVASGALPIIFVALVSTAYAQPAANRAPPPPVSSEPVAGRVHVLTGGGGANASLLVGSDAVLLVDSKSAGAVDQIVAIAKQLGGGPIRFLVNGHEHPDHTGGNAGFGKLGVMIVANNGVRSVLAAGQRGGPPEPTEALPTISFPDEGRITLYVSGERVDILHAPAAHTLSNSIVHYVDSNVLHLGDLYSPSRYQLIAGGTFQGFIDSAELALRLANENTKIIPGVGAVTGRAQLVAYRDMLVTVRDRVARLVAEGKTLEQVVAAHPTMEFDATWGSPDSGLFLPVIYAELAKRN